MRSIYELWMEQSKDFFKTADEHLKPLFIQNRVVDPKEHLEHIEAWISIMKQQWAASKAAQDQQEYWQTMTSICSDAADLMLAEWKKAVSDERPVQTIQELYQIWLNCCHEIYQHTLQSKSFQNAYGEMMNSAFNFWKSAVPTN